ncbi:bifunctional DNA primase/polymerase [Streptomyces anulatus]
MTNTIIETRDFPGAQAASSEATELYRVWREYSEQGLVVFPLRKGSKGPSVNWGRDWLHKGRTDTWPTLAKRIDDSGTIMDFPGTGLWLATGQVSKRVVLDLDKPEADAYWRGQIGDEVFEKALRVESGREGGKHLHFRIPVDDDRPWKSHSNAEIGYDFRADGAGVVLAPSVHKCGRPYRWAGGELFDAPEVLRPPIKHRLTVIACEPKTYSGPTGTAYGKAALTRIVTKLEACESGRNQALNEAAYSLGQLVGGGQLSEGYAAAALMKSATANGYVLKDGRDAAEATMNSGLRAGKDQPREPQPLAETKGLYEVKMRDSASVINDLTDALNDNAIPDLYVQSGDLALVEDYYGDARLPVGESRKRVVSITPQVLGAQMARHVRFYKSEKDEDGNEKQRRKQPYQDTLRQVLAGGPWTGVPPLFGITRVPVMRADGTVLNEEGYDRASGMYFDPMCDFHGVPLNPTREEVEEARTFLLGELLADFPFVSDADRANYVAALATPVLRRFIQGHEGVQPTPMLALNAVSPGTGKTLLANIIRLVFGGSLSEWTDDESELGKRVVSLLMDKTGAVCLLDNVGDGHSVRSPLLSAVLTSGVYDGRILGRSRMVALINDVLWVVTGNNMRFGGDNASRSFMVTLDADMERPDLRSGFKLGNLETWLKSADNRARVVRCLLVLGRAWAMANAPTLRAPMRGYDWWSDAMAGFLHFHGIPGFLANTDKVNDGDTERQEWAMFLTAWHEKFGEKPQGIGQVMKSYLGAGVSDGWDDTFILIERKSGRELSAMSAGIKLKERVDRPIGGLVLRVHKPGGPNSKKSNQYFVEPHRAGGGI